MTTEIDLPKAYDPTAVEQRWYPVWMERGYFKADPHSKKPAFSMALPPPNITGSLHLGHALTATIQDILCRWKRMSGYNVLWLPGTDHAGIATQMVVERELKATEKKTRHELGRPEFLKRVWAWKEKFGRQIGEQHKVLGASLDWSRERFTMDEGLSVAVREVFVRLHEEGLIYRDNKLINWCPSCLTALSDLEVEHEERDGTLWSIAYPVKGSDQKLVVATTRPETMLGDTAVAIHPEDPRYQALHGKTVLLPLTQREIPIILDPVLVDMAMGTGAVKVTPAHDPNDYQTGLRHKLPQISIFDERGVVNEKGGAYAGLDRFVARKKVLADLTEQGLLVEEKKHALSIGTCQRCGTVVEPRLSPQWFVKVEPLAKEALAAVQQGRTRFVPESWTNTYNAWMTNIHDWCISRQLWWGHQIPAWYPASGPRLPNGELDFGKGTPVVARENPGATAQNPSGEWVQDPDVLDTWFSSGLWPFSTLGWPEKTDELKAFYPTSVMETGHDIIFFWVARMMMMGLHFMKEVPFKVVYLHAMVRDEKGEKMSKTKGNVIDPLDVIRGCGPEKLQPALRNKNPEGFKAYGADALRFTLASLTAQGRDIRLSLERVDGYRAFCNKVWNASRFAMMNLGDFKPDSKFIKDRKLSLADRWILSRLNKAVAGTQTALTAYQFGEAASTLYQFLWAEFCDWYIELSKASLEGEDEEAKRSTRAVLVFCLDQILRLLHPFMPFITEEIWQSLPITRPTDSISIAGYPTVDRRLDDAAAETEMHPVITAIDGLRTIRGESNLPRSTRIDAHIQSANAQTRQLLLKWKSYLTPLAGLASLNVTEPGPKPPQAAAQIGAEMEIYVPLAGIIDLAEERGRLQKEITRVEGELGALKKKLENPNFVARAPAEVVEKDRARITELTGLIFKLHENLVRIAPLEVKIAGPSGGNVNLEEELKDELASISVPGPDQQVSEALDQLRAGTKEGLTARDRMDLGVAYMNMGLVDDAVREFNKAKASEAAEKKAAPAKKRAPLKKASPKAKSRPAKKVAPKKPAPKTKKPVAKAKKPLTKPKKPAGKGKLRAK
jgi:valyl-tRNA synthetase